MDQRAATRDMPRADARRTTTPITATDEIVVPRPPAEVWPLIADVRSYPRWWPRSVGVRVLSGGPELIGADLEIRPRGGRPFRCRVERALEPERIQMRYHGFVNGVGEWRLEPVAQGTRVVYHLEATAHGWLVWLVSRFIDLGRLHSEPMRGVLENLRRELQQSTSPAAR